jgi:hypothetical protein
MNAILSIYRDRTRCHDDSAWFYIRVYKKSGGASCTPYKLEVTNGVYGGTGVKGLVVN